VAKPEENRGNFYGMGRRATTGTAQSGHSNTELSTRTVKTRIKTALAALLNVVGTGGICHCISLYDISEPSHGIHEFQTCSGMEQ